MKIAVFGAGGIGGYYGARLAAAGHDVAFIARGAHLAALKDRGLKVLSAVGDLHLTTVTATADPADVGPVDVVLFTTKLWDTEAGAKACAALLGPDTVVISLQNGVDAESILVAALGRGHVAGGTTYILSLIKEPGVIAHTGTLARLVFGELDGGPSARLEAFAQACRDAGVEVELSDDIQRDLWIKFTLLASHSGVTALTRLPTGPILNEPETRDLLRDGLEEAVAVGRAVGIALPDDLAARHMAFLAERPPDFGSSMLHDLGQGRRLELPWLSGTVVRLGRDRGVPTPVHRAIFAALKPYALGAPTP